MLTKLRQALSKQEAYVPETPPSRVESVSAVKRPNRRQAETQELVLNIIRQREGQPLRERDIADLLGDKSDTAAQVAVSKLLKDGRIVRQGAYHPFSYRTSTTTVVKGPTKAPKVSKRKKASKPLRETEKRMLRYLSAHEDQLILEKDIAKAVGVAHQATVNYHVRNLCSRGLLERSGRTHSGTKYRVVGESANTEQPVEGSKPETVEASNVDTSSDAAIFALMESLMWEYMTEHWNTNMLQFRKWLQQKYKV